ncbi:MAG: hypothetical protein ACTHJI_14070 [Leifsonia sp.]
MTESVQGPGPDRVFAAEVELADPVERWLLLQGSAAVAHEIEGDFGIADMVAGYSDRRRLRNRRRQAGAVTDALQLRLLEYCGKWRTRDELRQWAPHGFSRLRKRAIEPLVERGLLKAEGERFRATVAPKDPFDRVVAVELKLRDASRGLEQASTYRLFADASYLAMPSQRVTPALVEAARRRRIGLLSVTESAVEEVVSPESDHAASLSRRRLVAEQLLDTNRTARAAGSPIYRSVSA